MSSADQPTTSHTIRLTGKVWPVDDDYITGGIDEKERGCVEGDIVLLAKLDEHGRWAIRGRHTNAGYSGYLLGFVFDGKARRRIVGWKDLFPEAQNGYSQRAMRDEAEQRVAEIMANLAGRAVTKVKGGWSIAGTEPAA